MTPDDTAPAAEPPQGPRSDKSETLHSQTEHAVSDAADKWFSSPRFTGFLTVLATLIAAASTIPLFYSAFTPTASRTLVFVLGLTTAVLVFLALWATSELRKNHHLRISRERADLRRRQTEATLQVRERELSDTRRQQQNSANMQLALSAAQSSQTHSISLIFRDIARARAIHSTRLYNIQDFIMRDPSREDALFLTSWRLQRDFLYYYCSLASRLFTLTKGHQCGANIKILWNGALWPSLTDLHHTEFGADPSRVSPKDVVYQTIARDIISFNDGRLVGEDSLPRKLNDNVIYRRIYQGRITNFTSNNILSDIADWQESARKHSIPPFIFPDDETPEHYTRIMACPIKVDGTLSLDGISSQDFNRLIGFLSLDSASIDVEFDKTIDIAICEQLSYDLASSLFEYFRCVRHMKNKSSILISTPAPLS